MIRAQLSQRVIKDTTKPSNDLLSLLLREMDRNPLLTQFDVHDEICTFLFATFDNYVILSNTLYHLGKHQEIQERLQREVDAAFAKRAPKTLDGKFGTP